MTKTDMISIPATRNGAGKLSNLPFKSGDPVTIRKLPFYVSDDGKAVPEFLSETRREKAWGNGTDIGEASSGGILSGITRTGERRADAGGVAEGYETIRRLRTQGIS